MTARHEDEHVATEAGRESQLFTGARGLIPDRLWIARLELKRGLIAHLHGEGAACGFQQLGRLHEIHQRPRHQCGGHDDDLQIRPSRALKLPRKGEHEITIQMPLMEFVDHDAAHALKLRIFEHLPQHDALGHIAQPRFLAGDVFKPHLIAHLATEACIALPRDTLRQHARSYAARLQHDAALALG